jgi:CarboxypepD_reg-like domain/TonB-dependent Receptor Plug Domain
MNRWFTILFTLLLLPTLMFAQSGKIKGKVTDLSSGEPLIGANVLVVGTSLGAATDVKGEYTIFNLQAGVYEVKSSYIGYQTITVTKVRVSTDLTTELNFQLPGEGISVGEVVVVSERPLINPSNTNAIRTTSSDIIDDLPVRDFNNILALTPGVVLQNQNIYIRGGRVDEVGYYLEGTNITDPVLGGRGVDIIQDAVEEIQVQAGGYTAEYGGANAGIVRTQLKSGTSDLKFSISYVTDNLTFKSKDNRFDGEKTLGAYQYGYNEFTGTISGPLFADNIKFFGLINSNWQLDRNPLPFPGIDLGVITDQQSTTPETNSINLFYPAGPTYGAQNQTYTGTGTLTFDFNPLIFRVTGSYTDSKGGNGGGGNINRLLDLGRISIFESANSSFSAKMTHILSPTTYYEISGGYTYNFTENMDPLLRDNWEVYGDSVANAQVGAVWQRTARDIAQGRIGRYQRPTPYDILGFSFTAPNDNFAAYNKTKREVFNFNAAFSTELDKVHSLKIGGELSTYTIRSFGFAAGRSAQQYANSVFQNSLLPNPLPINDLMIALTNSYGFDHFGNEIDGDFNEGGAVDDVGLLAPKKPLFAGAYVEDKITYKDLILNVGLRFDYFDVDNLTLKDPTRPESAIDFGTNKVDPKGLTKTASFSAVSPRIGFSFPVTDATVFHAQYGKFVQQSRLRDMYQGIYGLGTQLRGGLFIATPVGLDVRPTRTTQYEIGFTQQVSDFASFDITGYYKDIQDQVEFDIQSTAAGSPYQSYNVLRNGDFATTKGVEVSFNMRRVENIQVNASISFQDAQGTGSNPNSKAGIVGAPLDGVTVFRPNYVAPLDFNKAITGNVNLDYRFPADNESPILRELGLSALFSFDSGHPFTLGQGKGDNAGSLEGDNRFRSPIEALNSSTTPWVSQLDIKIDKSFSITDKLRANVYFFVLNLLDATNITNVFLRTGTASDDGYLTDPGLGGTLKTYQREEYEAMYRAINVDYYQAYQTNVGVLYGPPRQIRFGFQLEY